MTEENDAAVPATQQEGRAFFRNRVDGQAPLSEAASPAAQLLGNPYDGREVRRKMAIFQATLRGEAGPIIEVDRRADNGDFT